TSTAFLSCSDDEKDNDFLSFGEQTESQYTPSEVEITPYDGRLASDIDQDIVGTDEDLYWEVNSFQDEVKVTFLGETATIEKSNEDILCYIDGAYVTVDFQSNSVKNVKIIASGSSEDGQLKIYGDKKFMLSLNGLDLTCLKGPAINDQCKKRVFVHLEAGTSNYLTDTSSYSTEPYYLDGSTENDEDRKGCFFSEGNMIYSGSGALIVEGKQKHGIATDGYFFMRPGVTIVVNAAAKNCIHVKGDSDENKGIYILGGLIYASNSSITGKCLKTDEDVEILGGEFYLYTSGDSEYDASEDDTSSASGIKTDGDIIISGGTIQVQSTGEGGKGLSSDGRIIVNDGQIDVTTSGGKFIYTSDLTSSPKGIKADGDIEINGGKINISAVGKNEGAEGLESKGNLTINGGDIYIYAYDDALNAKYSVTINSGRLFCYSVDNDGIDSNGTLTINGGLVIASGTTSPEEGLDCDNSNDFLITGGTIIGTGGAAISPSQKSTQRVVLYSGFKATSGNIISILDSNSNPIMAYELPRGMNSMSLLFSSPDLVDGTYTISSGGTISSYTDYWNGWYEGGKISSGSTLTTFTSSNIVTTVGSSGSIGGTTPGGNTGGAIPGGNNNPGGIFPGGR
ncbi:MAG: carbohydrate-binding domain-containing protein, partial [Prevotella sp.]|nr:carbohydrate-binding domain-containing protein [Prevotella sp.]